LPTAAKAVDLDLFETRRSTVSDLKQRGKRAICYMSAGSWENWRPDKGAFPKIIIGKPYGRLAGRALAGHPPDRFALRRRCGRGSTGAKPKASPPSIPTMSTDIRQTPGSPSHAPMPFDTSVSSPPKPISADWRSD
jgi:hypothetical protein